MEQVTFVNNTENGPFQEFYPSGQVKVEGEYLNGDNEHGVLKFYNEDGVLTKTMDCNQGMCKTTWKLEESDI